MTARLDIRRKEAAWILEAVDLALVRNISQPKPHLRCPACDSILYTRRHKLCGVCGEELPGELLFTDLEASRVKALLRTEQQKHRDWMSRRVDNYM
jgi:hypothetical protein